MAKGDFADFEQMCDCKGDCIAQTSKRKLSVLLLTTIGFTTCSLPRVGIPLGQKNEKWFPLDLFVSSLLFWPFFLMSDLHARSSNKGMKECILVPSESLFLLFRARVD